MIVSIILQNKNTTLIFKETIKFNKLKNLKFHTAKFLEYQNQTNQEFQYTKNNNAVIVYFNEFFI